MQRGRVETRFTRLVGCDLPLQLAVLGGIGTTELAAEVAAAGGLGMVPGGVALPDSSVGSTGAGFLMPFTPPSDVVTEAARRCRVVDFHYGPPGDEYVHAVHRGGALCSWQVGSVEEAVAAERAGCDFVAADESAAHPAYRAALGAASGPLDTVLATHFDQDWPDAPHRVLTTALTRAEITGNRRIDPPNRDTTGDVSDMAMYAGEGVGAVHQVSSTREIAHELMSGLV